jgi:hypothetical protein
VYGHTHDWTANEEVAKRWGEKIAKAAAEAETREQSVDSALLTTLEKKNFQTLNLEVIDNT